MTSDICKLAFIGDYVPRQCGIATFTSDVRNSVAAAFPGTLCPVIPVNDLPGGYDYPTEVRFEIEERELSSYHRAADFLNINNTDVVCVQHEYGIYGGRAGAHLLALLRDLRMPVVTTLHTLLLDPTPDQERVMKELIELSTRLVVMTERAREILLEKHGAPAAKIDLIPHGIPDVPFSETDDYKAQFGVEGRTVLLTFGLLSPNKGIENVLNALPKIVAEFPDVVYVVLGATHPNLVREKGEEYRMSLEHLAKANRVERNVIFYNRFVEITELTEFIGAADIYITPYLNERQITSGTLAYTFGAGKVVVSTPYWHAAELLADGRGVLVPFGDAESVARETLALLRDEPRRRAMRKQAYKIGRGMIWSRVAELYMESFARARADLARQTHRKFATHTLDQGLARLPELKLDHLYRLTDGTGIFQHATYTIPRFDEGYCTDDNARALILSVQLEELGYRDPRLMTAATTYMAFLHHAFDPATKRFRNFMSFGREWLESEGSEDSHGRALWALGTCVGRSAQQAFQALGGQLFHEALEQVLGFTSPRAWAFTLLGIHEYLRRLSGDRVVNQVREKLTSQLLDLFDRVAVDEWPWLENVVAYDNARITHAMILSGRWTGRPEVFDAGIRALRWLSAVQTAGAGYFRPIGSDGFYVRGQEPAQFDQQPIEANAMVGAALEAFRTTNDQYWFEEACRAFEWFLGRNDLATPMFDPHTGGCRDGLQVDRRNENQGAESTLAFLCSLAEMRSMQNILQTFNRPVDE